MEQTLVLLAIMIGGWYWCWYNPLPHNMARNWRTRIFNFKGLLAYLVTGLLLCVMSEQYLHHELNVVLLAIWFIIFFAAGILFWIAPDGQRLDGVMGMTVTSNGRQLTLHLDTDQEYDVSKSNIHALANEIADLVEKTGLPLLMTTPLSCSYLVGLLQKDPRIRFETGAETKVPWPLWPMVAYRRHKRSRLPWGKAFTKSRNATSFCVHPLVQQS